MKWKNNSPKHFSELLFKIAKPLGLNQKANIITLNKEWKKIVGDKISSISRVLFTKRRKEKYILVVGIKDSVWLNELMFLKMDILKKMEKNIVLSKFNDIAFVYDKKKEIIFQKKRKKKEIPLSLKNKIEEKISQLKVPQIFKEKLRDFYFFVISNNLKDKNDL